MKGAHQIKSFVRMVRPKERGSVPSATATRNPMGAEDLAEQADQHHGPVAQRVERGRRVSDSIDPDGHADALPDLRVVG